MLSEFLKYIDNNHLAGENDRILLAVSGGIDSMVMADLFKRAGFNYGIAHCNFTLRGNESDKDEDLVRSYAAKCKVPFYSVRFATEEYSANKKISIEMAARELRYEWFEKTRKKFRFDYIAVAHNLNDNIETLLMNLTRGTGVAGLTGMKPRIDRIIRPLLFVPRQTIMEYSIKHKVSFREDKSNSDTRFTRNRIRHLVLPALKEINPSIEATLNETACRFSDLNEILDSFTAALRETLFSEREGHIIFNLHKLESGLRNKTILYELLKPYGITGSNLDDMKNIIDGRTGSQLFTGTFRLVKNRNEIIISPESRTISSIYSVNSIDELIKVPGIASARFKKIAGKSTIPPEPCTAYLDAGKIIFPLIIRKWKKGDYFYPLGMNHKKKLSDFFIDMKLSRPDKDNIQVVESSNMIVWVIGERIDNRFRITDSTKKALIIKASCY